jgi:hypothetical protein
LGNVTVKTSYRGILSMLSTSLRDEGRDINVTLSDRRPPRLANITFDYYFRPAGEALVSADVDDAGGAGVNAVWLTCSIDGKSWTKRQMYRVGEARYEATVPGLGSSGTVRFRVLSDDWLGNTATGPVETRVIEAPPGDHQAYSGPLGPVLVLGTGGAVLIVLFGSGKK